jgi:hypothetical protein
LMSIGSFQKTGVGAFGAAGPVSDSVNVGGDLTLAGGLLNLSRRPNNSVNVSSISVETSGTIALTESELEAVAGGAGSASFDFAATASGKNPAVTGTATIAATPSSASIVGVFIIA